MNEKSNPHDDPHHLNVAVLTTSGRWPTQGYDRTSSNQKVRVVLDHAAKALNLTDTTNWLAKVGDRELDQQKSFSDSGLTGDITIDFGPRAGGGGRA